tara:strand:+ start:98 stop:418 length:321 start_codon:yes stop_codon:yes gene_type:complete
MEDSTDNKVVIRISDEELKENRRIFRYRFSFPDGYHSRLRSNHLDPFLSDSSYNIGDTITGIAYELAGYEEALGVSPLEYELSLIGLEEETVRAAIDEKLERYRKK